MGLFRPDLLHDFAHAEFWLGHCHEFFRRPDFAENAEKWLGMPSMAVRTDLLVFVDHGSPMVICGKSLA